MLDNCKRCGSSPELLDPETGLYYCFGCGQPFYPEIAMSTARDSAPSAEEIKRMKEIVSSAGDYYRIQLESNEAAEARKYLLARKISADAVNRFGIGYAPTGPQSLLKHLRSLGFLPEDIANAGLATRKDDGELLDHIRDRLVFPLANAVGEEVGFSGRMLKEAKFTPKYLNTRASAIYRRNSILFNCYNAAASGSNYWILTEGYTDVISLDMHGFHNAVSTMGTALNDLQVELISRQTRSILVLYDGDGPGAAAMYKAVRMLAGAGLQASSLILRGNHDPDSYLKQFGAEHLKREIQIAQQSIALPRIQNGPLDDKFFLLDLCRKLRP